MATGGLQKEEGVNQNHLKQQLALAVRSIQWSYAIFWSISTNNQGVLEWGGGYYNGDIKTRKTLHTMEFNASKYGLQRSEQLRELYEFLLVGETNQHPKRSSASLSPEDLSDAEWYYLVCMSFTFNHGQGLPGKALANNQHIWLCNAHFADSKVFTRSLLAKSASIHTVMCFPFLGGVIELGVTETVLEDLALLQHVKTALMEFKKPTCSETSQQNGNKNGENLAGIEIQPEYGSPLIYNLPQSIMKEEIQLDPNGVKELNTNICDDLLADSPENSSDGFEPNQQTEDSFSMDVVNGGASQVQSWQFMDNDLSHGIPGSVSSSDCISRTFLLPNKPFSSLNMKSMNKLSELDLGTDDIHYSRTLSTIFKTSKLLMIEPCCRSCNPKSSFRKWKKRGLVDSHKLQSGQSQKTLKKILFQVPYMHSGSSLKSLEQKQIKNGIWKPEECGDIGLDLESKTEELNEKFIVLKSLVPSMNKTDKTSILNDTIDYLKELERRVDELESCRGVTEIEARNRRKPPDIVERTSDNYGTDENDNPKKPIINKRKASDINDIDEIDLDPKWVLPKDGLSTFVTVCLIDKEILIEISCPWKECLLLEIIDAINDLHLEAHSVQSSNSDGFLTLNIKSKFKEVGVVSAGMIKQAIQRVISKF